LAVGKIDIFGGNLIWRPVILNKFGGFAKSAKFGSRQNFFP